MVVLTITLIAGLLFAAVLVLKPDNRTEPASTNASNYSPPPKPKTFSAVRSYKFRAVSPSDEEIELILKVGKPSSVSDFEPPPQFENLVSACNPDQQRDAVVPMLISVQNATDGFDISLAAGIGITANGSGLSARPENAISMAFGYEAAPECKSPDYGSYGSDDLSKGFFVGTSVGDIAWTGVAPNARNETPILAVLGDYFSPSQPDGDPEMFADQVLSIYAVADGETPVMQRTYDATCLNAARATYLAKAMHIDARIVSFPAVFPIATRTIESNGATSSERVGSC